MVSFKSAQHVLFLTLFIAIVFESSEANTICSEYITGKLTLVVCSSEKPVCCPSGTGCCTAPNNLIKVEKTPKHELDEKNIELVKDKHTLHYTAFVFFAGALIFFIASCIKCCCLSDSLDNNNDTRHNVNRPLDVERNDSPPSFVAADDPPPSYDSIVPKNRRDN